MGRETAGKLGGSSGGSGPQGQGNRQAGGGQKDEFGRLVAMIELIRKTLGHIVEIEWPVIPSELQSPVCESWPRASESLRTVSCGLRLQAACWNQPKKSCLAQELSWLCPGLSPLAQADPGRSPH